jgi:acetaldehyde dehydrogenase/alcohol dehydrogenase
MAHKLGGEYHAVHGLANSILLPYVIQYNGQKPQKLALWPKYNEYVADTKYQTVARLLGLDANTPAEGVTSLAKACRNLALEIGCPTSLKELGIDEKDFLSKVPMLAELAFEDQCTPANPRLAMCKDMEKILIAAYYGEEIK